MNANKLSGIGRRYFDLIEFDENEQLIREIRKHPVGLVGIYLTGISVAVVVIVVLIILTSFLGNELFGEATYLRPLLTIVGGVVALLALAMTAIGAYIYQSNVIFITSEEIAQVLYRTIFDRKISQLNINNIQDVTVNQKGLLARLFRYGTIVIETAGEQQNYQFTYVPDPYYAAKDIVSAHEKNVELYGN